MKKLSLLCLIIILLSTLSGCPNPRVAANHPCMQFDTTWVTADGRAEFYVPENDWDIDIEGLIRADSECVEIILSTTYLVPRVSAIKKEHINDNRPFDEENVIERWELVNIKPGKYTVRVEETTYFTPGEILTFYCVDGNHLDDPEYLQAEIAKLQREERKSQWIARGILAGVVVLVVTIIVLLVRRKRHRRKLG